MVKVDQTDEELVEAQIVVKDGSLQEESFNSTQGLTILTTAVFIVGEIAGTGVLALPKAVEDAGWIGIVLIIGCCFLSSYTGQILGKAWVIVQDRYPNYRGHVRYPYPVIGQITYGKPGRYLVSFSINFTMFGGSTVFLLLAAENIESLVGDLGKNISFCYWLMLIAAALVPVTWLGTPKDFWFVAVGATVASSIACAVLFSNIIYDNVHNQSRIVHHPSSGFVKFFMAIGTIAFAFGGHPAFPTFQTDMKNQKQFGHAALLGYLIVLAMYLPVSISGYFVYGKELNANILKTVPSGPMQYIVEILITAHLLFAFAIVLNPVCQEMEEVFKVPKQFTWKRCLVRTVMVAMVLFVAESIPHFGAILSLVGGSTVSLLAYVCPSLFYLKLCRMRGDWSHIEVPIHIKVLNYEILAMGVLVAIVTTYATMSTMVNPDTFTVPCYVNLTASEGH